MIALRPVVDSKYLPPCASASYSAVLPRGAIFWTAASSAFLSFVNGWSVSISVSNCMSAVLSSPRMRLTKFVAACFAPAILSLRAMLPLWSMTSNVLTVPCSPERVAAVRATGLPFCSRRNASGERLRTGLPAASVADT